MRFQPKTEKEVAEAGLWKAGLYDFEIAEAAEKISAKGNDMIELKIRVYDADGNWRGVFDWLVDTEGGAFKTRHFADCTGMLAEYEKGELRAEDLVSKTGRCKLVIKKDKSGEYPDKNAIADYIKPGTGEVTKAADPDLDDSIPF